MSTKSFQIPITKAIDYFSSIRKRPILLSIVILSSMCFCFFMASFVGYLGQWLLLLLGSVILVLSLAGVPEEWKMQLLVSFILAIPIEYFLSVFLGWYSYSFGTVPPWVFIGHSIVHFGALVLGFYLANNQKYKKYFLRAALLLATLYGVISFILFNDQIGLICTIIMIFLIGYKSKYQLFYASFWMFVVWLEWWGVFFGQWHWASSFVGLSQANPPANIVAGYCVMAWLTIYISERIVKSEYLKKTNSS